MTSHSLLRPLVSRHRTPTAHSTHVGVPTGLEIVARLRVYDRNGHVVSARKLPNLITDEGLSLLHGAGAKKLGTLITTLVVGRWGMKAVDIDDATDYGVARLSDTALDSFIGVPFPAWAGTKFKNVVCFQSPAAVDAASARDGGTGDTNPELVDLGGGAMYVRRTRTRVIEAVDELASYPSPADGAPRPNLRYASDPVGVGGVGTPVGGQNLAQISHLGFCRECHTLTAVLPVPDPPGDAVYENGIYRYGEILDVWNRVQLDPPVTIPAGGVLRVSYEVRRYLPVTPIVQQFDLDGVTYTATTRAARTDVLALHDPFNLGAWSTNPFDYTLADTDVMPPLNGDLKASRTSRPSSVSIAGSGATYTDLQIVADPGTANLDGGIGSLVHGGGALVTVFSPKIPKTDTRRLVLNIRNFITRRGGD